jgi:hypothetical protein
VQHVEGGELVRPVMLCEALHACEPTVDYLYADEECIEAKTLTNTSSASLDSLKEEVRKDSRASNPC